MPKSYSILLAITIVLYGLCSPMHSMEIKSKKTIREIVPSTEKLKDIFENRVIPALLLDDSIDIEDRVFHHAFELGDVHLTRSLLDKDMDPNSFHKETLPLTAAVEKGHRSVVALLLNAGAKPDGSCPHQNNPNNRCWHLWTACNNIKPLLLAARQGDTATVLMLIAAGARKWNWQAIEEAVESGNPDTVKAILDLGWGPGLGSNLRTAVRQGNAPIVKLLLDHKILIVYILRPNMLI